MNLLPGHAGISWISVIVCERYWNDNFPKLPYFVSTHASVYMSLQLTGYAQLRPSELFENRH